MSSQYSPFPDAEAAVSWILRNANVSSGRVYSSVPATPTYPLVVVQRVGGLPAERHRLDRARIQIDVWGESKSQARTIADLARTTLHDAEGTSLSTAGGAPVDAVITAVDDDLALVWVPDPVTDRDRYALGVAVYLHAP